MSNTLISILPSCIVLSSTTIMSLDRLSTSSYARSVTWHFGMHQGHLSLPQGHSIRAQHKNCTICAIHLTPCCRSQEPIYLPNYYASFLEFREVTLQRLKKFTEQRFFSSRDYLRGESGGHHHDHVNIFSDPLIEPPAEPRKFMAALESLFYCDYSLSIKAGVHFTLCGGTICKLGTKKHHDAYLDRMDTLDLPGSFSMTELGHGSNVMGIETVATYDPSTKEFIINTPSNEASKYWIGGTGQHGKLTAVFAQLTVNGKWEGPHVFMVRIRDDQLRPVPGVRIKDLGPKMGLNGVDNGQVTDKTGDFSVPRCRSPILL